MTPYIRSIPNLLTAIRLAFIPIFIVMLWEPTQASRTYAAVLFAIAAITDFFDGFLARKLKAESDFGRLFDPLADKILVMAALVLLVGIRDDRYGDSFVPAWMVVLILAREMWVTGIRGLAATKGIILSAGVAGKIKSFFQMIAVILLLLHEKSCVIFGFKCSMQFVGLNLLMLSILISLVGVYDYSAVIFKPSDESKKN